MELVWDNTPALWVLDLRSGQTVRFHELLGHVGQRALDVSALPSAAIASVLRCGPELSALQKEMKVLVTLAVFFSR